jgi:hypothetical protein
MRIAFLLSSLVFAACTVGEVDTSTNNNGGGSGSGSGSGSNMSVDPNACVDRFANPEPAKVHPAGIAVSAANTANAGENCIKAGCHLNNSLGANAPGYQFAGTIYKNGTTTPDPGVTVKIISNNMVVASTISDQAGNFAIPAGTVPGAFTASTLVAACPTVTKMVTPLVGGNGGGGGANSCNSCHLTGANAQAAPIFLQ